MYVSPSSVVGLAWLGLYYNILYALQQQQRPITKLTVTNNKMRFQMWNLRR
jgi:hypothetical protein